MDLTVISIIVPTFNRAAVLTRALDSVVRQTWADWELLVVDDGSSDTTAAVFTAWSAKQTGPQLRRYLRLETNQGVSAARNAAVREARGEWLAFLDSDDEWLPEKLERQMSLADQAPLIHSDEMWIRNGVQVPVAKRYAKSAGRVFPRCVDVCFISPSTTMMRTELYRRLGGFREDFPACEDYELWLRVSRDHEVACIYDPLVRKHGGHADQLSRSFPAMDYYRAKALLPFLGDEGLSAEDRGLVARSLSEKCTILLKGYAKHGQTTHVAEVEAWARKAETHCQSTHSAAER